MKSQKAVSALAIAVFAGWMIGCDGLLPTDADSADITVKQIDSVQAGFNEEVQGELKGDPQIDLVNFSITKDDEEITDGSVEADELSDPTGKKSADLADVVRIATSDDACNGMYKLVIEVTAGSETSTKSQTFKVFGGRDCDGAMTGTPVTTGEPFTAGAQSASSGSFIDLDGDIAYTSGEAPNHVPDIDLFYGFHGGEEKLMSPAWSRTEGFMQGAAFANARTTEFAMTSLTPSEFNAIEHKEEISSIWDSATPVTEGIAVNADDVLIAETSDGATALVLITAQAAGEAGTITVKIVK